MRNNKPIQISIPQPCHEDWNKMTPNEQGRLCAHCQKTVVDFTHFSDSQLYRFLTQNNGQCCGRFLSSQLNRPIAIPYQPYSRLYQIVIGLGLTLIFTQIPQHVQAQTKAPVAQHNNHNKLLSQNTQHNNQPGVLKGTVLDNDHQPIISAAVIISKDGITKAGTVTNLDGQYIIPMDPGNYDITYSYLGFKKKTIKNIIIKADDTTTVQAIQLEEDTTMRNVQVIVNMGLPYVEPLPDTPPAPVSNPDKKVITSDELKHSGH